MKVLSNGVCCEKLLKERTSCEPPCFELTYTSGIIFQANDTFGAARCTPCPHSLSPQCFRALSRCDCQTSLAPRVHSEMQNISLKRPKGAMGSK
eukprot:4628515-Amphidinium_carterae.1